MALVNRIARLFKADFHAVLDQLEEPEPLLKQAIRDMEDELGAAEQRITAAAQNKESLGARIEELQGTLADIEAQLDLCFASGRDELAKKMIRRKLETERLTKRLVANREAAGQQLEEERRTFEENRSALESLRQKAELIASRRPTPAGQRDATDDLAFMTRQMSVSDEEIEIAYLREKGARSAS